MAPLMNVTIPDDYQDCVRYLHCFEKLARHGVQVFNDSTKNLADLAARLVTADAIVLTRERTAVSAALLDRLPRLRFISQTGSIGPHVDLDACTARGIAVADGRGSGISSSTAELAWALVLASRRHLLAEANRLRDGLWQGHLGRQLKGRRLGIWSYGRIGRQVAAYGKAFGMEVWVWGGPGSTASARADGYAVAPSREAFFIDSDVVSLHLRLVPETRGIITLADLSLMKPTGLLVNTSRAELLAPHALERALRQGRPGFAAVDVYEEEPVLGARHPLLQLPNALCTPHIGFVEQDNYESAYGAAFDNIARYAAGEPVSLLNPEVLQHERQKSLPVYSETRT
ncbi:D-3-phosphoglycerate dehydrogenase OS=Eoetvoesiella caeni OX=645616 GN=DFR37_10483 PE=3 SV=1 [Eoetvoesiella caeni]